MKIIATSDWHLGNLFHGNDRLPEHKHFLQWLLTKIKEQQPDALLIAGDIFDNGNPSAAAQTVYYEFLAEATQLCPHLQIIITAGNHDSASRLEAPRPLLSRYHVEIRGNIQKVWKTDDENGGHWVFSYEDLIIPITDQQGHQAIILAVPFLRSDVVQNASYSKGVNNFLRELTALAREKYPDKPLITMAHMYAKGSDIAQKDASEKIIIGGQEEVDLKDWNDHPDYMTCGHIHKRQHIWNTDWARYTGSVLPMSFAEKDYQHGVDFITLDFIPGRKPSIRVEMLAYTPQHPLVILPENEEELTLAKWSKLLKDKLPERTDKELSEHFAYVMLKVKQEKLSNDDIKTLETLVQSKDAVLCKIQRIIPQLDISTIQGSKRITSIEDIVNRPPLDTLKEAFAVKHNQPMNSRQEAMLTDLLSSIENK